MIEGLNSFLARSKLVCSEELNNHRRSVCLRCDNRKAIVTYEICEKCGCVLAFKTKLITSACPIGKW